MNLNIMPQIDISLPFISYGVNGLLINMISMAFILLIYRRKDILIKENKISDKKVSIKINCE